MVGRIVGKRFIDFELERTSEARLTENVAQLSSFILIQDQTGE